MPLDRLPRAARRDPELLVVVAGGAAGGERVAEPEAVVLRDRVGGVRERRRPLVGRDHEVGVVPVEHPRVRRVDDLAVDEVVGDVEQGAHVGDVLALDLLAQLARIGRPVLEVEAALRPVRHDLGVLGHLRPHQAVDLGAVVHAVRPADAAARDPPAAQVDPLHVGRVDVDLHQRRGLGDGRHVGGAQLEAHRAAPAPVGVGAQRRLDQAELVAQDAVVVERLDLVQRGQDRLAHRLLGRLVALVLGVEAQLEQLHEVGGQRRVLDQRVVLVALGEARADALAVLAVCAQDLDLVPVQARREHEPVERVGLRVAAPDGRDAVGDARAVGLQVDRLVARTEHPEVLHPGVAVAAGQARRDLLDHAQPEVLEHRHRRRQLDLAAALVEADARALALARRTRSGARRRTARRASPAARSSRCRGRRARRWSRPCSSAGSARPTRSPARGPARRRGALISAVAQLVVPRAGGGHDLALELAEVEVDQAAGGVDAEVHLHAVALAEHEVVVDRVGLEALAEQRQQALQQVAVVARARQRDDQRRAPRVGVAAAEQPHLLALQREQRHDRAAQVVGRGGEQLVLRERVEQRDRGLVVVRALDQVLGAQDLAQLAVQQRRLARGLAVGLGGEQAEHPGLADDLAVGRDPPHADVVHPHRPVHAREPVGLGDDQQVALERPRPHAGGQRVDRHRLRVRRARDVGEDPEPRVGHDRDRVVAEAVLAVAEEDEVVAQQPLEEGDGLVDLLVGVARRSGARELDHPPRPVGHRGEVLDRGADVGEHLAQRLLEPRELLGREPAVEVEVHDRLAPRGLARVQHRLDRAVGVALDADDRVQDAVDPDPAAAQRGAHRVDQERPVLGVGLHHRAGRLVAVLLERRREGAHRDRLGAARGGELEGADDLVAEGVGRQRPVRAVGGEPAQEGLREGADGRGALRGGALADQVEQGRPGCHVTPCSGAPPARRAALRSRRAGGRRTRRRTRGSAGSPPSTARRRRRGSPRAGRRGCRDPRC